MFASLGGKKKEQTFVVRCIIVLGNLISKSTVAKMTASRPFLPLLLPLQGFFDREFNFLIIS